MERSQRLRQPGEVAADGREHFRAKTGGAQTGFRLRQFHRVGVEAEQTSAGLEAGENFLRVTTVAERAIHGEFAGPGCKRDEDFRDHDGPVRAGGRLAGRQHFGDGVGVTLRIALLVFLLEPARVLAGIAHAPLVRSRGPGTVRG